MFACIKRRVRARHFCRGFTLIELTLVLALVSVVSLLVVPTGIRFFETQILEDAASELRGALRFAQAEAILQKNSGSFGVRITPGSFTLFEGDSYATRISSEDHIFTFRESMFQGGDVEVVFEAYTGVLTMAVAPIVFTLGSESREITIREDGFIE